MKSLTSLLFGVVLSFGTITACTTLLPTAEHSAPFADAGTAAIPVGPNERFANFIEEVSSTRVIYVGETHTRYDHHLNQLAVIEHLHDRGADLAIGLEFFQRQFQQYLDAYVSGGISEKTLLKKTGYYRNWRYDFRLYRPILAYARENRIPLVALNAPTELVQQVSQNGWDAVDSEWRAELPTIQVQPDSAYRSRLESVFERHPGSDNSFDRFLQVQLLWDEYMAESAASYLAHHPQRRLVVLAGSGHVAGGQGIPRRVKQRLPVSHATVLNADSGSGSIDAGDYLLVAGGERLPSAGKLGIYLSETEDGVTVERITDERKGHDATVLSGDRIAYVAGERIGSVEDLRIAMLDRRPGERVWVELERAGDAGKTARVSALIELI